MDHSSIKKALLMQLMAELSKQELSPFKKGATVMVESEDTEDAHEKAETPKEEAAELEIEIEPAAGSKADRLKKLKKLAATQEA